MFWPALLLSLGAAPPPVVSGPDSADKAQVVEAPIARVTVFSDRARVLRQASLNLSPGPHALRLPDLRGAVLLDTIRVSVSVGEVLRVEAVPVMRERISIDQVDGWLEKIEVLSDQVAVLDAEGEALGAGLGILSETNPAPAVPEAQREGRPLPSLLPELWKKAMDFLTGERARTRERLRALAIERRKKVEAIAELQRQVQRLDLGGFSDRVQQILAIVNVPNGGKVELELEYFSSGASWRPSYDLRYDPVKGEARVDTSGAVTQATGEDWSDVELELSTAIPGQSIALPKLLTWTLGEAKELIPIVRPKTPLVVAPLYAPPVPVASRADIERGARLQRLSQRIGELQAFAQISADDVVEQKKAQLENTKATLGAKGDWGALGDEGGGGSGRGDAPAKKPASRPPATKRIDFNDALVQGQLARPPEPEYAPAPVALGSSAVSEVMSREESDDDRSGSYRDKSSAQSVVSTPLSLFERPAPSKMTFSDPGLPAVSAGGLDYVYAAQTKASVKSSAESVRVPLGSERYPISTYYRATPGIDDVAYLEATVMNKSQRPILTGPLQIFVAGDFVGDGAMETTGPGGKIKLPLGADEDIRLKRKVITKTDTQGVFSKDDVTTYKVVIEIGNYKKSAVKLAVKEPLPKTNNEDMEIELLKASPKQTQGPNDEGILTFELELAAGKTKTIELEYKVTRPANWQLYQR